MALKIKRHKDEKIMEFFDIVVFLYERGLTHFIFEDINKARKNIPISEVESFQMEIFNLVIDSTEDNLKTVKKMNSISFDGERGEFILDYNYGRRKKSTLDVKLEKVHFLNGVL